jgi:hypothetical protein
MPSVQQIQETNLNELTEAFVMWSQQWRGEINRRSLLTKISIAVTAAAAAPLFDMFDSDDLGKVTAFAQDPSRFSEPTLRYCEEMATNLRRQGDALGPELTLQSAMGHRHLAHELARTAPAAYRSRAISAYAELTQIIGWFSFNMRDYHSAQHYYDDARNAAHDAENVELVTYVLCMMSHLATWRGKPRVGIDHAVAAMAWAEQSGTSRARAYAADVAVRAYLADGQNSLSRAALDREHILVKEPLTDAPMPSWWYFYDESFYWATEAQHAIGVGKSAEAITTVDQSLALLDPRNLHEHAHRSLYRADAFLLKEDIAQTCVIIGEIAGNSTGYSSGRVDERIADLRTRLTPWQQSQPVRELDEMLVAYRESAIGSNR